MGDEGGPECIESDGILEPSEALLGFEPGLTKVERASRCPCAGTALRSPDIAMVTCFRGRISEPALTPATPFNPPVACVIDSLADSTWPHAST